eukprot:5520237-Pyramimonas_sp.AAC.2
MNVCLRGLESGATRATVRGGGGGGGGGGVARGPHDTLTLKSGCTVPTMPSQLPELNLPYAQLTVQQLKQVSVDVKPSI